MHCLKGQAVSGACKVPQTAHAGFHCQQHPHTPQHHVLLHTWRFAVLRWAVLCCTIGPCVSPCCVMLCWAMQCYAMLGLHRLVQQGGEGADTRLVPSIVGMSCFIVGGRPSCHGYSQQPIVELILHSHNTQVVSLLPVNYVCHVYQ